MQSVIPLKKENNCRNKPTWTCFTTKYDVITLFFFNNTFHVQEIETGWSLWSIQFHICEKMNSYNHTCGAKYLHCQWSCVNTSVTAHDRHIKRSRTQFHCSPTLRTFNFASVEKPMLQVSFQPLYLGTNCTPISIPFSGSYHWGWCRVWRGRGADGGSIIILYYACCLPSLRFCQII